MSVVLLDALASCSSRPVEPSLKPHVRTALPPLASGTLAFVGVNVVAMTSDTVAANQTVIVRDGIITAVGPVASTSVPANATRIESSGRYLMPGLMDMHVHVNSADVNAYLDAGITTVRNMWGTPGVSALRREVMQTSGALLPTIYSASPGLDGAPASWPYTTIIASPADGIAAVDAAVIDGWDYIKVYDRLSPESYRAILQRAAARGISVIGHVPRSVNARDALVGGQHSIEHLTGYPAALTGIATIVGWQTADPSRFAALARETAEAGVWNCPTLAVVAITTGGFNADDRAILLLNRQRFVKALYDAGAPLLVGTDAGIGITAPGTSLSDELSLLVASGLSPVAAVRGATIDAARFLGISQDVGTITVGKRADLVLLNGNPLRGIDPLRAPLGIVLRGQWRARGGSLH